MSKTGIFRARMSEETKAMIPFVFVQFAVMFIFLSCQTIPVTGDPFLGEGDSVPLDPGAVVYVFADVKNARSILERVAAQEMDQKQTRQLLDRTDSVAAAIYPTDSGRLFQMTAWGNFPSGSAGIALGMNKDWKKIRSVQGHSYWYSRTNQMSVAVKTKQAYVAAYSGDTPSDPVSAVPPLQLPPGFHDLKRGSIVFCWFENPGVMINRIFQVMELPLQLPAEQMFISLFASGSNSENDGKRGSERNDESAIESQGTNPQYQAIVRIETPSESQARAIVTLISMARLFSSNISDAKSRPENDILPLLVSFFFANAPVQEGRDIIIKTAQLSENEITLLLEYFSLYLDII